MTLEFKRIIDRDEFKAAVPVEKFIFYIEQKGWKFDSKWGISYKIYKKDDEELNIPSSNTVLMYQETIASAIKLLAVFENRCSLDVYEEIKNLKIEGE